jgi:hypothetical protein
MIVSIVFSSLLLFKASPVDAHIFKRSGCSNFFDNGISTTFDSFSLWTQYDESGVQLPLALGTFDAGTSAQLTTVFLVPEDFAGVTVGNLFQLNTSGLVGIGFPDDSTQTSTWPSGVTESGSSLPFTLSPSGSLAGMNEDYCGVASTDPNGSPFPGPVLSVQGTPDEWSICNRTENPLQLDLVFQAVDSNLDYNFSTCQSVHVYLNSSDFGIAD